MAEWIAVGNRLPDVGLRVLVSDGSDASVGSLEHPYYEPKHGPAKWEVDSWNLQNPTHWMPLPEPPKENA